MGTAKLWNRLEKNEMHLEELSANQPSCENAKQIAVSRPRGLRERSKIGSASYLT